MRSIADVAPRIKAGTLSPVDLVRECLDRAASLRDLNVFTALMERDALQDAEQAGREI
jgi:Asp-tRNA(Asn)/Glu-tRNA(Gln) amidotransferase A subunit family amidase